MKFGAVAVLAVLALAVFADNPVMPKGKLCSIQGSGSVKFISDGTDYKGSFTMKRVNETAIFNIDVTEKDLGTRATGALINRLDLDNAYFDVHSDSSAMVHIDIHGKSNPAYTFNTYTYDEKTTTFEGKDCYTFSFSIFTNTFAAIYFSRDKKMELLGEQFFDFADKEHGVTFVYDKVAAFQHDSVDGSFSMKSSNYPELSQNAEYALTSACKGASSGSASVAIPSLVLLLLAAMAILF